MRRACMSSLPNQVYGDCRVLYPPSVVPSGGSRTRAQSEKALDLSTGQYVVPRGCCVPVCRYTCIHMYIYIHVCNNGLF